jgi:hypothetical protein
MLSVSFVAGLGIGIIQGYLCYPTILWARILTENALLPWKDDLLPVTRDICLILVLIFLAAVHFAIALNIQSVMSSPKGFGRAWVLGLFLGLCFYILLPMIEKKIKM